MDATLMFSASALLSNTPSSATTNAPVSGVQPVSGTDTTQTNTPQGRIFAGLMRDLLPTHERQDVAAAATSDPAGLKSENLGGQLEVITASSDQPDAGSLSAFARAQGLDESAVMALFGEKIPALPSVADIATTATATTAAATSAATKAAALNAALLITQSNEANILQPPVSQDALDTIALFGEKISSLPAVPFIATTATPTAAATEAAALNAALLRAQSNGANVLQPPVGQDALGTISSDGTANATAPNTVLLNSNANDGENLLTPVGQEAVIPMAILKIAIAKVASDSPLKTDTDATNAAQILADMDMSITRSAQDLAVDISVEVKALDTKADKQAVIDSNTLTTASWLATQVASMVKTAGSPASTAMPAPTPATSDGLNALSLEDSLPVGMNASMASSQVSPASISSSPQPTSTLTLPGLGALGSLGALGAMPAATVITSPTLTPAPLQALAIQGAPGTPGNTPSAAADEPSALNALNAVSDLAPAMPAPQDAMRIRLVPAWANVTQQLHSMSGTAMTSAWGALTAATLGGPIRSVVLDLRNAAAQDPLSADDLSFSASSTDTPVNAVTPELTRNTAPGMPLPASTPTLAGMAQTLRQEHYQQLADRLGQAMAERLQNQIARGEWKLQMRLNPANLGRIDVELGMHAKGLDAMFRSDNPLTRELMAQSMPKLKDSLSQSGMAVASVWVNSDAERQSDGKPTPQRDARPSTDAPLSAQADKVLPAVAKVNRTPDGFDVLA